MPVSLETEHRLAACWPWPCRGWRGGDSLPAPRVPAQPCSRGRPRTLEPQFGLQLCKISPGQEDVLGRSLGSLGLGRSCHSVTPDAPIGEGAEAEVGFLQLPAPCLPSPSPHSPVPRPRILAEERKQAAQGNRLSRVTPPLNKHLHPTVGTRWMRRSSRHQRPFLFTRGSRPRGREMLNTDRINTQLQIDPGEK